MAFPRVPNAWQVLLFFLLLQVAGCALPSHPPQVVLQNIRIERLAWFSQTLKVELLLQNPNAQALHFQGGQVRLLVDGQELAQGLLSEPISVPAYGTTRMDVPVIANLFGSISHWGQWARKGAIPYQLTGYLITAGPLSARLPFQVKGVLHVPELPGQSTNATPP
ncbi:MAG: LEA type 2 family protein [Acidithiobacillus sp.]|nr:LEA type 2 family protein [Acidithiobacillus sp.]